MDLFHSDFCFIRYFIYFFTNNRTTLRTINLLYVFISFNPLSTNPTKCFSVFDHFVGLALKGLRVLRILPMGPLLKLLRNLADRVKKDVMAKPN